MTDLRAVMLNCTLKYAPEVSNTEALMLKVKEWWDTMDVETELVRVTDFNVRFGVSSDEDDAPQHEEDDRRNDRDDDELADEPQQREQHVDQHPGDDDRHHDTDDGPELALVHAPSLDSLEGRAGHVPLARP